MFGYVSVDKPEMKIRDYNTFKALYCGLCKTIRREYGQAARLLLNYDCTMLYVLAAAVSERPTEYRQELCPTSKLKKKTYALDEGAELAAAVNMLLAYGNLEDDARDEGGVKAKAAMKLYAGVYEKAQQRYPRLAEQIARSLERLALLERSGGDDMDRVADVFADMLGFIFAAAGQEKRILYKMGYNIGRWIYIADAYADVEKDLKSGSYNAFIVKYGPEKAADKYANIAEDARFAMNASIAGAGEAYDLLRVVKHKAILDNIVYRGLYKKTESILAQQERKNGSALTAPEIESSGLEGE